MYDQVQLHHASAGSEIWMDQRISLTANNYLWKYKLQIAF